MAAAAAGADPKGASVGADAPLVGVVALFSSPRHVRLEGSGITRLDALAVADEALAIWQAVGESGVANALLLPGKPEFLARPPLDRCQVLHIAGHCIRGATDAAIQLILEDDRGVGIPLSSEQLSLALAQQKHELGTLPEVCVLNCCHSKALAKVFIGAGGENGGICHARSHCRRRAYRAARLRVTVARHSMICSLTAVKHVICIDESTAVVDTFAVKLTVRIYRLLLTPGRRFSDCFRAIAEWAAAEIRRLHASGSGQMRDVSPESVVQLESGPGCNPDALTLVSRSHARSDPCRVPKGPLPRLDAASSASFRFHTTALMGPTSGLYGKVVDDADFNIVAIVGAKAKPGPGVGTGKTMFLNQLAREVAFRAGGNGFGRVVVVRASAAIAVASGGSTLLLRLLGLVPMGSTATVEAACAEGGPVGSPEVLIRPGSRPSSPGGKTLVCVETDERSFRGTHAALPDLVDHMRTAIHALGLGSIKFVFESLVPPSMFRSPAVTQGATPLPVSELVLPGLSIDYCASIVVSLVSERHSGRLSDIIDLPEAEGAYCGRAIDASKRRRLEAALARVPVLQAARGRPLFARIIADRLSPTLPLSRQAASIEAELATLEGVGERLWSDAAGQAEGARQAVRYVNDGSLPAAALHERARSGSRAASVKVMYNTAGGSAASEQPMRVAAAAAVSSSPGWPLAEFQSVVVGGSLSPAAAAGSAAVAAHGAAQGAATGAAHAAGAAPASAEYTRLPEAASRKDVSSLVLMEPRLRGITPDPDFVKEVLGVLGRCAPLTTVAQYCDRSALVYFGAGSDGVAAGTRLSTQGWVVWTPRILRELVAEHVASLVHPRGSGHGLSQSDLELMWKLPLGADNSNPIHPTCRDLPAVVVFPSPDATRRERDPRPLRAVGLAHPSTVELWCTACRALAITIQHLGTLWAHQKANPMTMHSPEGAIVRPAHGFVSQAQAADLLKGHESGVLLRLSPKPSTFAVVILHVKKSAGEAVKHSLTWRNGCWWFKHPTGGVVCSEDLLGLIRLHYGALKLVPKRVA